jgi:hypothetical protein
MTPSAGRGPRSGQASPAGWVGRQARNASLRRQRRPRGAPPRRRARSSRPQAWNASARLQHRHQGAAPRRRARSSGPQAWNASARLQRRQQAAAPSRRASRPGGPQATERLGPTPAGAPRRHAEPPIGRRQAAPARGHWSAVAMRCERRAAMRGGRRRAGQAAAVRPPRYRNRLMGVSGERDVIDRGGVTRQGRRAHLGWNGAARMRGESRGLHGGQGGHLAAALAEGVAAILAGARRLPRRGRRSGARGGGVMAGRRHRLSCGCAHAVAGRRRGANAGRRAGAHALAGPRHRLSRGGAHAVAACRRARPLPQGAGSAGVGAGHGAQPGGDQEHGGQFSHRIVEANQTARQPATADATSSQAKYHRPKGWGEGGPSGSRSVSRF